MAPPMHAVAMGLATFSDEAAGAGREPSSPESLSGGFDPGARIPPVPIADQSVLAGAAAGVSATTPSPAAPRVDQDAPLSVQVADSGFAQKDLEHALGLAQDYSETPAVEDVFNQGLTADGSL